MSKLAISSTNIIGDCQGTVIGLFGRAGSGKTTLASQLAKLRGFAVYSGDYRFKLNSLERKDLLQDTDIANYVRNINQFNWWDFKQIEKDLKEFKKKRTSPYQLPMIEQQEQQAKKSDYKENQ